MTTTVIDAWSRAHAVLAAGLATASVAWPEHEWTADDGGDPIVWQGHRFRGLRLHPGTPVTYRTTLTVPERLGGSDVGDDVLELTLNTLYRAEIRVDGVSVLAEDRHVAAAPSPALSQAIPIRAGQRLTLELELDPPDHQVVPFWVHLHITTRAIRRHAIEIDAAIARMLLMEASEASSPELPVPPTDGSVEAVVEWAERTLDPLIVVHGWPATEVHAVGHAHLDVAWLWTWDDIRETIVRDVTTVLDLMDEHPEMCFTASQAVVYDALREARPDLFDRVCAHVREGRWEAAAMTWVEADTNLASGASLVRQVRLARQFFDRHVGVRPTVYMAPDNFGHTPNLPQLIAGAGGRAIYHTRARPELIGSSPAYWWQGLDGSRVLAITSPDYHMQVLPSAIARCAIAARQHGLPAGLFVYGVGDHGGGPTRQELEVFRRWGTAVALPKVTMSTFERYVDVVSPVAGRLPVLDVEHPLVFEGCYSTHADAKRANRESERELDTAAAIAAMTGGAAPRQEAVAATAFNQFHDILPGSSIRAVYDTVEKDRLEVAAHAGSAIAAGLARLVEPAPGVVTVVNPGAASRTDAVAVEAALVGVDLGDGPVVLVDDAGHGLAGQISNGTLCAVVSVPAFGAVTYSVRPWAGGRPAGEGQITVAASHGPYGPQRAVLDIPDVLEPPYHHVCTPYFDLLVRDDNGVIVSLVDLRNGRQLVRHGTRRVSDYQHRARPDAAVNVLQVIHEQTHGMSAWALSEIDVEQALIAGATTTCTAVGDVHVDLTTVHTIEGARITSVMRCYRDLPRIDVTVDVDWSLGGSADAGVVSLALGATLAGVSAESAFEVPFGAVTRPADGRTSPSVGWGYVGDDSYGLGLVTRTCHGFDALGSRLRVTLVRNAYCPDPASDEGRHRVELAWIPHAGGWQAGELPEQAHSFTRPLMAVPGRARPVTNPLPVVLADGAIVSVIAAGDGIDLLAHDPRGLGATLRLADPAEVWNVVDQTFAGEATGEPMAAGDWSLQLAPFGAACFRVVRREVST